MLKMYIYTMSTPSSEWVIPLTEMKGSNHYVLYVRDSNGIAIEPESQLIGDNTITLGFGFGEVSGKACVLYEDDSMVVNPSTGGIVINNTITYPKA